MLSGHCTNGEHLVVGSGAPSRLSVVVPVSERPQDLRQVYEECASWLRDLGTEYEVIFVAQPWYEAQLRPIAALSAAGEPVRALVASQSSSEATLLKIGCAQSSYDTVLTLPAYPRIDPPALPSLLRQMGEGVDMVVARRWPRRDSWINRLQNRVFHALVSSTVGGQFHDLACGVRVLRKKVLTDLPLYGDFFRFLPLLAAREGYRVVEFDAPQDPRDMQPRVHGIGIYIRRAIDVLGLFFVLRFTQKPLRFFGLAGTVALFAGIVPLLFLLAEKIGGYGIADRPLLVLSVLLIVVGLQTIALGLIGEMIVHLHAPGHRFYRLADRPGSPAPFVPESAPEPEAEPVRYGTLDPPSGW